MKRLFVIILCIFGIASSVLADEMEDSLVFYYQQVATAQQTSDILAECDGYMNFLRIYKALAGDVSEDTLYASIEGAYANLCFQIEDYETAIRVGKERSSIYKRHGANSHKYALSLVELSDYLYCNGKINEAIDVASEALEIRINLNGINHLDCATCLDNLAVLNSAIGYYNIAFQFENQAIEIRKELEAYDLDYARSLSILASLYSAIENYYEAIQLTGQALEIIDSISPNNLFYATILDNRATYYSKLGNYNEAIKLGTKAMEIIELKKGTNNHYYTTCLGNLASNYSAIGNYDVAIDLETKVLAIREKAQRPLDYASSLNNLAFYYGKVKNYNEAIKKGREAMEITKRLVGKVHPLYFSILSNLASNYSEIDNFDEAISIQSEAMEIIKRVFGTTHSEYALSLGNLAYYYVLLQKYNEAIPLLNDYIPIIRENIHWTFPSLTAHERQLYWNKYTYQFNSLIPRILVDSRIPNTALTLYDNTALFAKGLLLSTELEMTKLIQESGDKEALQMYSNLRQNRQILNAQYSKPISERHINCDSLYQVSSNLEKQLVSRVKEIGDYTKNLSMTWQDVQSKLNKNDIAIEFLSFPENDSTTVYVALTLCQNDTAPVLTRLFTELEMEEASGEDGTYQTPMADSLIWEPLASRFEDKSHVYFSASGMLHNIGIEYLPSMEDKECYRLSSTRELVTHHTSSTISSATLYGGIDYKASYASIESSIPNSVKDYAMTASTSQYRGLFDYRTLRYGVSELPGTREEITEVSAMLKPLGTSFETLSGTQASEESFKALSGQRKSLIHIATHGFYYNSEEADNLSDNLRLMFIGENRPRNVEDQSLLRCGLCFAGANQILSGKSQPSDGQDDGILNALEIAQTDLRGLDLVVLSACQTALGDIAQGEGVFGLQRGFKKAGAQSILMSLWEVDNDATHLLMTEFYKGWTSGLSKFAALRQAQAVVKEKYPDPKYWAAFILLDAID